MSCALMSFLKEWEFAGEERACVYRTFNMSLWGHFRSCYTKSKEEWTSIYSWLRGPGKEAYLIQSHQDVGDRVFREEEGRRVDFSLRV